MSHSTSQGPPKPRLGPVRINVPSRSDSFLRKFTEVIGGPLGRHSSPGRISPGFFTVERVLVIFTVIAALLAVASKNACRMNGWGGTNSFAWACYSDWTSLFHARGFAGNPFAPFAAGAQFEYPVLMSVVASLTAWMIPAGEYDRALAFFDLNFLMVVGLWLVVVIATARTAGRRPWDAAMVALGPGIILASTINWDMWAVAFLALALLASTSHAADALTVQLDWLPGGDKSFVYAGVQQGFFKAARDIQAVGLTSGALRAKWLGSCGEDRVGGTGFWNLWGDKGQEIEVWSQSPCWKGGQG